MKFYSVFGDGEADGDFFVAEAAREHLQDFAFARGGRLGEFGEGARCGLDDGEHRSDFGGMRDDEASGGGLERGDELLGGNIAGENGADADSESAGGCAGLGVIGKYRDRGFRRELRSGDGINDGIEIAAGGFYEDDVDDGIGPLSGERIEIGNAADNLDIARCGEALQARASERSCSDDEDANHAATEFG